jgi:hypothetical protein
MVDVAAWLHSIHDPIEVLGSERENYRVHRTGTVGRTSEVDSSIVDTQSGKKEGTTVIVGMLLGESSFKDPQ